MKKKITLSLICACILSLSGWAQSQEVSFEEEFFFVNENEGVVELGLAISNPCSCETTINLELISNLGEAIQDVDFTFIESIDISLSEENHTISLPIIENASEQADRFFAIKLIESEDYEIGDQENTVVFIRDVNTAPPAGSGALGLEYISSFLVDADGSAEIIAHHPSSQRLYVMNSNNTALEILDFSDPMNMNTITSIDLSSYGIGGTSVAVYGDWVAVSIEADNFENGKIVFLDIDGNLINDVEVGVLPDMIVFTPDGSALLSANEGEPSSDYEIDPEGSISYIDLSNGIEDLSQLDVTTMTFNAFDSQIEALRVSGVRIFGFNASVSQDLEPEYITISDDGTQAWCSLQENNALAVIDLLTKTITDVLPLGTIDHSLPGNTIDVSDKNDEIFMANWNIHGMFMPDAIANYTVGGVPYIVTANEGDQREFGPIDEDTSVDDDEILLDPVVYTEIDLLEQEYLLGRIAATPYDGDIDNDGDIDQIHTFGTRSFSIWNSQTGELVYDSGDDFERITAADPVYGELFNASNSNNNFKNRSDNKGPEPEGVTTAVIGASVYAFITLERVGGIMAYDVTDPLNPVFVSYKNSRSLGEGEDEGGDLGPEGIIYINAANSPTGIGLVLMANEVSSTISVYNLNSDIYLPGCTDSNAINFDENATYDDGSCILCVENDFCSSFESSFDQWTNSSNDDFDWSMNNGGTPSSGTGPDEAYDGTEYIYIEASFPNFPAKSAELTSTCFSISEGNYASFSYHMEGTSSSVGSLSLSISTDFGDSYTEIWSAIGNQGNEWIEEIIDLSDYANQNLYFKWIGTTANSWRSDIAIDAFCVFNGVFGCTDDQALNYDADANIADGSCQYLSCEEALSLPVCDNFEDVSEVWINDEEAIIDWTVNQGGTPSLNTGPEGAVEGDSYIYLEASYPNYPNKQAILNSPCIDLTEEIQPVISFSYQMNGAFVGHLSLEITSNGQDWIEIWNALGDQGNVWFDEQLDLSIFSGNIVQLRFIGETINGWEGDIALDALCIYSDEILQNLAPITWVEHNKSDLVNSKKYTVGFDDFQEPEFDENLAQLTIYPNPLVIGQQLNLASEAIKSDQVYVVQVFDAMGSLVMSENIRTIENGKINSLTLPQDLSSGVYMIQLNNDFIKITDRIILSN